MVASKKSSAIGFCSTFIVARHARLSRKFERPHTDVFVLTNCRNCQHARRDARWQKGCCSSCISSSAEILQVFPNRLLLMLFRLHKAPQIQIANAKTSQNVIRGSVSAAKMKCNQSSNVPVVECNTPISSYKRSTPFVSSLSLLVTARVGLWNVRGHIRKPLQRPHTSSALI